jgi:hypothetical protein
MLQLRRTRLRDQAVVWLGPELSADDTERIAVLDALLSRSVIETLVADLGSEGATRSLTDSIIRIVT